MNCPKCKNVSLSEFKVEDIAVDRCSSCSGLWFDASELGPLLIEDAQTVAALRKGAAVEQADDQRGRCPRDGVVMLRIYSSIDRTVILDACAECHGFWLDGGEFEKLHRAQQHS